MGWGMRLKSGNADVPRFQTRGHVGMVIGCEAEARGRAAIAGAAVRSAGFDEPVRVVWSYEVRPPTDVMAITSLPDAARISRHLPPGAATRHLKRLRLCRDAVSTLPLVPVQAKPVCPLATMRDLAPQ